MFPSKKTFPVLLITILLIAITSGCSDETVCPEPEPEPTELVIGISYHDWANKDLRYVEKTGEFWGQPEVVQYGGNVGQHSSLAFDAEGNPHICYYDYDNGDLKYAVRSENGWHRFTVDWKDRVGNRCSIDLDAQGNPHICYIDEDHGMVKYAWNTNGYWDTTTVEKSAINIDDAPVDCRIDKGSPISLAIDASGTPHISYYSAGTNNLAYITKINNKLHVEAADQEGNVGMGSSLALDSQGNPHISYLEYVSDTDIQLKYARKVDGVWIREHVPENNPVNVNNCMAPTTIAVDDDGTVHICYHTNPKNDGTLVYAVKHPGSDWEFENVDEYSGAGLDCSLVLDAQGNPHVSYYRGSSNDHLKYAVRIDNEWTTCVVDIAPCVGMYTSIALCYR